MTTENPPRPRPRARRRRWWVPAAAAVLVVAALGVAVLRAVGAERAGRAGQRALLRADAELRSRELDAARLDLGRAETQFRRAAGRIGSLGPLLPVARAVPLVKDQLRGVQALAAAGELLAQGGSRIVDAAGLLTGTEQGDHSPAETLDELRRTEAALGDGVRTIDAAATRVRVLRGATLPGPVGRAYHELQQRLPGLRDRAQSLQDGLGALVTFVGGSGPRRYLVLSQNPDELRPTGGFIGTYGILAGDTGRMSLERYDSIESWAAPRPGAVVAPAAAPTPFQLLQPAGNESLANVNAAGDWPAAATLAMQLLRDGGEAPVDGVLGVTPEFLARVLGVLGPVELPSYGEFVTSDSLLDRLDYYTHGAPPGQSETERKRYIAVLAPAVFSRLLAAPSSSWEALATAIGQSLAAREAMLWSNDADVARVVAARRWDGALPTVGGDFSYDGEFEYAAKNGRGLRRVFTHEVTLHADGSARVATTVTITNTEAPDPTNNIDSASYITLYGPVGAVLAPDSDTPTAIEPPVAGHPAAGWVRAAPPQGTTTFRVVWDVPRMVVEWAGDAWEYDLHWMHIPAHTGDVLDLRVDPPPGWRWAGPVPPTTRDLDADVVGSWLLTKA